MKWWWINHKRGLWLLIWSASLFKTYCNSYNCRLEQTTSSANIFTKTKLPVGKYLKKSCSYLSSEQCFFKFVRKYFVRFSRRHCQKSKMATLRLCLSEINWRNFVQLVKINNCTFLQIFLSTIQFLRKSCKTMSFTQMMSSVHVWGWKSQYSAFLAPWKLITTTCTCNNKILTTD
jgi:hypothetical protein